jgi:hypothetical protein
MEPSENNKAVKCFDVPHSSGKKAALIKPNTIAGYVILSGIIMCSKSITAVHIVNIIRAKQTGNRISGCAFEMTL